MRYTIAIIHTILLVVIPMIMIPIIKWWSEKYQVSSEGLYWLLGFLSVFMFIITILRWIAAIKNKDIKNWDAY